MKLDWYFYLIIGAIAILIILLIGLWMNKHLESSMISKVVSALKSNVDESFLIEVVHHVPYQIEVETSDTVYLIKTIRFNPSHELIITNQYYWCINENIKNYKRSEKPVLVSNVPDFLKYQHVGNKKVVKLAIIYPGCYNRTRYLNESDVELVNYKKPVHQVYFLTFDEIKDFFISR